MAFDNSNVPTTPKGCEFRDDYLSYTQSGFSWFTALFLSVFWGIWTSACFAMVYASFEDKEVILFMIPFLLADIGVLCILLYTFFGKETGWMDETGFHQEYRCLFVRLRKDVPLNSIRKFKLGRDYTFRQNKQPAYCVQIVTAAKEINVMRAFTQTDQQRWLAAAGNAVLANLTGREPVPTLTSLSNAEPSDDFVDSSVFEEDDNASSRMNFSAVNRTADLADEDSDERNDDYDNEYEDDENDYYESKIERFSSSDHISDADKPVGTSWKMTADFDTIEFKRRGRWTAGLIGTLFVAAFWNGIVSIFLCALFGVIGAQDNNPSQPAVVPAQTTQSAENAQTVEQDVRNHFESLKNKHLIVNKKPAPYFGTEWWFIFCFLIPFEIIGLVMIWAFLSQLFAPFTTQSWTFSSNKAIRKRTLFGFPFTRRFDMMEFSYLEIHHSQYQSSDNDELTFHDRNDRKIFKIKNLNRADARWIANEVLTML
ncbi:MAG: hypothetical protein IJG38_04910 [Thermoguttaceae bacterium]|nr:hypothetical protein [Thermoguttaceae bacterium]